MNDRLETTRRELEVEKLNADLALARLHALVEVLRLFVYTVATVAGVIAALKFTGG
ncbi:MAG: hypothetical protein KAH44_30025 [Oricola sp.]|nr:hypothetical protein [Oricola sp.]